MRLGELPVLVIDCQTTGASPARGQLLEVGWCACTGSENVHSEPTISSALVTLPAGKKIPFHITRLTGVRQADMAEAISSEVLLDRLLAAGDSPGDDTAARRPCVAHYARFEKLFLDHLHGDLRPDATFPLEFICTCEIGRRIFPDLPRRGLRAIAGYFGFQLTDLKRAGEHVAATVAVWQALVQVLAKEHDVETLAELSVWLSQPAPMRKGRWQYPLPREKRLALADRPGVYRFLGRNGEVLYVGKATSLKERVNSYYRQRRAADKTLELVSQAWDLRVSETETALEAALLEVAEIKAYEPTYNRALRDRGQAAWFFTDDLMSSHESGDERHWLGPIPNKAHFESLCALSELLSADSEPIDDEQETADRLGLVRIDFEDGAVRDGLTLFAETRGVVAESGAALLYHGARLWREHQAALEAQAAAKGKVTDTDQTVAALDEPSPSPSPSPSPAPATAEDMARYLDHQLIYAARLKRRARWLIALAEATVLWRPGSGDDALSAALADPTGPTDPKGSTGEGRLRYLTVTGGKPGIAAFLADREAPPVPAQHPTRRRDRCRWFDRPTYDCLRVLLTELKRLAADERLEMIVFSSGTRLQGRALARLLAVL